MKKLNADHEAAISILFEHFGSEVFSTYEAMNMLAKSNEHQSQVMDILFCEAKKLITRIESVGDDVNRGFLFQFITK